MEMLVSKSEPNRGVQYPLEEGEAWTLGRHPDCEIVIEDSAVSRFHAKVFRQGQDFFVEDLKSRNKTRLNDELVEEPHRLNHGDQITICDCRFVFLTHEDDSSSTGGSTPAVFVDEDSSGSTIMSRLNVSSHGAVQMTASPEAKLNALLEINGNLGKALSLDKVLPQVLDSLFKIFMQADRGFIALLTETGELVPRWSRARRDDVEESIRISRTIVNRVMDSQEAVLSADAANDDRFIKSQSIVDFRIRSMMCAPLIDSEKRSMGVMQIDTLDQRKRFQQEDLEVLVAVASQAGIAIDNANLHEQALRRRALERDMELARGVQQSFLPDNSPQLAGYQFHHYYQAANHVGGDYFDYVPLPDGRTAVVVADVVGHGVAAALLMAKLSAESRFCLATAADPAAALTMLNTRLSKLHLDRFITFVMVVLDATSHRLTIVNAGHMLPILRHPDGTVEELGEAESGIPLNIVEDIEYEAFELELAAGDQLVLYTDGLNEATGLNPEEQFGIERVRQTVAQTAGTPETVGRVLIDAVRAFMAGTDQDDDMCLVVMQRDAE